MGLMAVEGETPRSLDRLDLLASEVGFGAEQELEREGLLGRARAGAASLRHVPGWTKQKVANLVDAGLDRVYAAPLEVTTAAEAMERLAELRQESAGNDSARRLAKILAAAGPVMARLARGRGVVAAAARTGVKVVPTGRMFAVGTTAVLMSARIGASALTGTRELQILASYLMNRLRRAGLPADRDLVEQIVVQAYLAPEQIIRVERGTRHDLGALAKAWTARGIRAPSPTKQVQLDRKRVTAIERLDLHTLMGTSLARRALPRPQPTG
jgi:hypothetical protein